MSLNRDLLLGVQRTHFADLRRNPVFAKPDVGGSE